MSQTPAGWYPHTDGTQRYWDGTRWTEHTSPMPVVPPVPPVTSSAYPVPYAAPALAHPAVAPKNPGIALLVSFFFPGVGSMMNGEAGKGVAILLGYLVSVFVLVWIIIGIPIAIGLWIWGMVDAYQGAQKWNARHGIIS